MKYYAQGKLLITGEYAVLDGAIALAIPCKYGQSLEITPNLNSNTLVWKSLDVNGAKWLEIEFDSNLDIITASDHQLAEYLQLILSIATQLNPKFVTKLIGVDVTTTLEFDRSWGLGSSSTLIHLISQWAKINPYKLLEETFEGSGYDIACADASGPILYQTRNNNPFVSPVKFSPEFTDKMWFIHLGAKQNSGNEIIKYSKLKIDRARFASQISNLTQDLIKTKTIIEFITVIESHESLVSSILGISTVKQERFSSINGTFKSLGAWGGDFVLFIGEESELQKIKNLGYSTILPWGEMLIS